MAKTNRRLHGEGSVIHRKDGRWVAVEELGMRGGKRDRRYFYGDTPDEAMAGRQLFRDRRRDGFVMPKGRQPYVSEWVLHWFHNTARRKVEGTTWQGYRSKVEMWIAPYFERIVLPELTEEDVEDWHRWLEGRTSPHTGRPLSPSTIAQTHRILSVCIKGAVVRGKLPRNPVANVSPPRVERAHRQIPSAADVERILARCETWENGCRWTVALKTGIRQGEALALRWSSVNLTAGTVAITESAAIVDRERVVKAPKSAKGKRTIPLSPAAVVALKAHRQRSVRSVGGLVFTKAGQPVMPWSDLDDWRALLADVGLPAYGTHDCRRVVATMLLEAGTDPRVVQDWMGWSQLAMTEVYQQVRPALLARAADVLG